MAENPPMCNCLGCQAHQKITAMERIAWERLERLRAVEALAFEINAVDYSDTRIERIRALLRGEGDQPAEVCADCGHARDKHPVGLARLVIYCQGAPSSAEMCRCKRYNGEGDRPARAVPWSEVRAGLDIDEDKLAAQRAYTDAVIREHQDGEGP